MERMKPTAVATLIGDLVHSRRALDRRGLHERVTRALAAVNEQVRSPDPLAITAGDEFQGSYASVGQAVEAAFGVWSRLWGDTDVRFGLGWGEVTLLDPEKGTQDGPGWWAARSAIEAVASAQGTPGLRQVRTAYRLAPDSDGPAVGPLAAALLCRDHLVGSLDERSRRILRGLMDGQPQSALAEREGISPSAVSQRVRREGLALLVDAQQALAATR